MSSLPGSTVGIIGGGQLGRMIAHQARRMGYRIIIMDPDPKGPAAQASDEIIVAKLTDKAAARELASRCDVVTIETEHIPWELLAEVEKACPLRPSADVLRTIQDRLRQKEFLEKHGFPQPAFAAVDDAAGLDVAIARVGAPALLKSRTGGYDGKGQARIMHADAAHDAWATIGNTPSILEAFVSFTKEVSVILARSVDGEVRYYPLAENVHIRGVLHTTRSPANVAPETEAAAQKLASEIATALGHVGVMAVEMFVLPDGSLQVNEIAPRVHNSGHFTLGACATSQFEQHLRAICGVPLGDTTQHRPAVMLNLLGDAWANGTPDWGAVLSKPEAHLHLYGKADARPGRKMAHIVVLHEDADAAMQLAERIHDELMPPRA